jgi:hypothetical protein
MDREKICSKKFMPVIFLASAVLAKLGCRSKEEKIEFGSGEEHSAAIIVSDTSPWFNGRVPSTRLIRLRDRASGEVHKLASKL